MNSRFQAADAAVVEQANTRTSSKRTFVSNPSSLEHAANQYAPQTPPDHQPQIQSPLSTANTTAPSIEPGHAVSLGNGALAVTSSAGTSYSPKVDTHPREREIHAHEEVHRRQMAVRGSRPMGNRKALESEARRGSQVMLRGHDFEPRLAASGEPLAFEHASAGGWLADFEQNLFDNTDYDVEGIDWTQMISAMLASTRVVYSSEEFTALDLSMRLRYQFLLEVFSQEIEEGEVGEVGEGGAPPGLVTPTVEDIEDFLLYDYLPLTDASMFAAADVENVGDAFLGHWLDQLETVRLVPEEFDISLFSPPDRSGDIDQERERALEDFMASEVPDLMFRFMLDEFARAVGGPAATVEGAPLILGGGEIRTITPEQWLASLDMETYRERLVSHLGDVFDRKLREDQDFRRLLLRSSDERSRFASLLMVHNAIVGQQEEVEDAVINLRTMTLNELESFEYEVFGDPANTHRRLVMAQEATTSFYAAIQPGLDNDAALMGAVDGLLDALNEPGEYEAFGGLLRVVTLLGAYQQQLNAQTEAARSRINELVEVSYEQIAEDIQRMAAFAAEYLEETWIPKLHEVALRRISANVDTLQERKDNWDSYTAQTIARLDAGAAIFTDVADVMEEGTYESVTIGAEVMTAADVDRLRDAATIMRAEADALRDPETNSERFAKLQEALDGFDEVKGRIERGEVDPNLYGAEVLEEARQELGLDTFREYTTYADVIFGREVASQNPFLARLVVTWKYVEVLDDAIQNILVFAALGLLTVASLLVGSLGTVAFWVMFSIDATLSIGMGIHQVNAADALLELVRLDLDQSVTGLTEEQAENALLWAWVGLALSVVLTVGGLALGAMLRYGTRAGESLAISLRYYRLAVENPSLFASLRSIVRDPVRLSRMLDLAGDAMELERLLHRMDRVMDLTRAERLLELAGDATRVNSILDIGHDAATVEQALVQLQRSVPNSASRLRLLDAAFNDVVPLAELAANTDDLQRLTRMLDRVPADRLAPLARSQPLEQIDDLLSRGVRLDDLESGIGVPGGGLGPATVETPAPLPSDVTQLLRNVGVDEVAALQSATAHEAGRLRVVLGNNGFPRKAGPEVSEVVGRWAAEGVDRPTGFINRWEYARGRFIEIEADMARSGAALPAGVSRKRAAADALIAEIRGGVMTERLASRTEAVRALAGRGFTQVGGNTADEVAAGVRANAQRLTFGDDTSAVYHVNKHADELPEAELPMQGASWDARMGAYVGSARRTIAEGALQSAEIADGTGPMTFVRVVENADGSRIQLTAYVYVRDGRALISSYQGANL